MKRIGIILAMIAGLFSLTPAWGQADSLCVSDANGFYHVNGWLGSTFTWDAQGNGVIMGQGNDSVSVAWTAVPGTYTLSVFETSIDGCDGPIQYLTIEILPEPVVILDIEICLGNTYTLPDGSVVGSSGIYDVVLQSTLGCDSTITTNLSVVPVITNTVNAEICNGQTYTLPDGSTVTTGGSYDVTLTSVAGCDSIVTTIVDVIPVLTSTTNAEICNGQTYTLPDGSTVTTGGSYDVTLTSVAGCDSIVTTIVDVVPVITNTVNAEICNGQSYTLPDGSTVTTGGSYDVTLTSVAGCDSIVTTIVDVVPVVTSITNAEICNGQSYTLPDGSTVTTGGSYDVTLTSVAGCDSIVTTIVDVVPVITNTVNAEICNGQTYTLPDGSTVTTGGSYDVTLTSVAGCDSIVTTIVDVVPVITNTVNAEICNGQTYTLPDGSTVTTGGSYDVTLTSVAGCDSIVTTIVDVVPVLTSTINAEICNGQTYTLPDGSTVTTGGSYDVTLTSVAGCDSIVTTIVDVVPVITNTVNAEICAGGSYTLPDGSTVTTGGSYDVTLTSVAGCDSIVTTIVDVVPVITNTVNAEICAGSSYTLPDGSTVNTAGSYDVTLTSVVGCDSIVTTIVDVVPVITNTVNAEICNGQTYTLPDGSTVTTGGSYDVTLTSVAGCDSIVTTIVDVVPVITNTVNAEICAGGSYTLPDGSTVTTGGSYDVTLTSVAGCDSIVTTIVDVVPVITNTVNAEICNGQSYTLPDGSTVTTGGSYDVTLTSVAGCDSIVTTIVDVVPVITNTVNAEICNGQSYTLPDGSTVTTGGSYDVTLTSVAGCDSIVTTIVDVVPVITNTVNAEICNGQTYTLPDGSTVSTGGSYDVTLTSVAGCDSIVTTIVDVIPVITNTVNAEICNGQSYTLPDGSTVTTGGSYDVTLTSVAGCDSIVTTIVDVVPVLTSITNAEICAGSSYTLPDGSTVTTGGSYDVTLTSVAGCDSIVTTIVDVVPVLTSTINAEICNGQTYTLPDGSTVTTGGSYDVTLTSVAGCDSIVTTIVDVVPVITNTVNAEICAGGSYTLPDGSTVTTGGSYDVTLTSVAGCDSIVTTIVDVVPVITNTVNAEICAGSSYTLPDGSTVNTAGSYDVTLTSVVGCDSIVTTIVDVVPVITNTVNAEICNGQTYTLPDGSTVTTGGSYDVTLTSVAGCDSIVTTIVDVVPVITNTVNAEICAGGSYTLPDGSTVTTGGSYDVTLTSVAGCDSIVTTIVDVVPVITNTVNAEICNGQSYTLPDGSTVTTGGSYDVTLTSVAGCDSIVTTIVDVVPVLTSTINAEICNGQTYTLPDGSTVTTGGSYDVTLTSVAGCDSIVTTIVDVVPVITNTVNAEICAGSSYTLPDGSTVNTAGSYDVTLTSVAGCDSIVTTIVDVVPVITNTVNAEICNGQTYTLPDGSTVSTGGSYDVTLTSVAGCDSIVTTIVDVIPVITNTVNAEICNGQSYTLPDGSTVTTGGSYDVTLTSVAGCDSIVTTILDVVPVLTNTVNAEICAGGSYTLPDGSTVTTGGSYDVTLTSVAGCDSIVTTIVDVVPVITNTVNAEICAGGSYTLPDGSTVTTGGSYDVTLTSVAGCDSIVTTIVDVVPVITNTVNAEICNGQSYTLPDGSTVTTGGSYDVTLTSVAGCDSIVTTIVDVVPVITNTVNAEICNGQTYTLPDGSTVTAGGSYDVTLTSVAGCDSIVTTILDVVPVLTNTVNAEICAGGSYTLPDGSTVTTGGSYDVTLTSVAGCDSIVTTIVDVVPVLTSTINAEICNGQTYTLPDGSTVTTGGSYDVTLTSVAGCDSIVTTIVDVVPVLTSTINAEICNGQTYTLPDGSTVTTGGSYDVTLTSVAGCDSIVTTIVDVVPVLTSTINAEICNGQTYTLPDGSTVTTGGSYDVTLTSVAGCDSIVTTIVDVVPVVTSITNTEICNGQTYTLPDGSTVTTGGSYDVTLTSVAGCDSIVTTIVDVVPVLTSTVNAEICAGGSYTLPDGSTVTTGGSYDVTLTSVAGCDSIVTTIVDVVPVLTSTINAEICNGQTYTLPDGSTVTTGGSYDVTLTSVAGCDSIVTTIVDVIPVLTSTTNAEICSGSSYTLPDGSTVTTGGSYDVTLTSVAGCDSIVTTIVDVVPVITNTVNAEICNGQTYTLPDGSTVTTGGSYDVTLTSVAGCDSIVTTIVDVIPVLTSTTNAEICAGSSYTLPDGSTVTTGGSYDVTLTSVAGCDSIVTTIVDVVPVITNTVNAEICNGQTYTLPDGSTVTTGGSYDVTLTSVAGCDSIVTTIVDVIPVLTSTTNAEICSGSSYTLPDGSTVTTGGSYDVTLTSVAGCDSIVTTIVDVIPVITNTVNAEICAGSSYTLPDGSTVTTGGSYDVTLTSVAGCDSIVTTIVDVIPVITNTVNAEICAGSSYTLPDGSTVTTGGSYDVTLTSAAGCDSIVTTLLIVNPVFSLNTTAEICEGQAYTLPDGSTVNTSGSYIVTLQTVAGCDSIITTALNVVPVLTSNVSVDICAGETYLLPNGTSVNTAGSYDVTLTSVSGCDSIVTTVVNILPVYTSLVNAEICSGDSYSLPDGSSANTSGSYSVTLQTVAGCDSTIITQLIVLPIYNSSVSATICANENYLLPDGNTVNTSGNYPVVLTAVNGCDSTVITVLTVFPVYTTNQNISICQGDSYLLADGTSVSASGTYSVTLISSLGCDSTIVTNLNVVDVIPQILNNTGTTVLTCTTPVISLTATGGLSYIWNNGLGNSATVNITVPGTYSVTVVGPNGCSVSTSIVITQDITPPIAGIVNTTGDDLLTCALTSIALQATGNGTYQWSSGLGTAANVNVVNPGIYGVVVTAANGCTDTIDIEILQDISEPAPTYLYYELCQGESLQLQDGTSVGSTGIYNVILQAANGCDSLIVNDLLVHPIYTPVINVDICPDDVYTLPNGVEVETEGTYPISYQSIFGCDSTVTFVINELPVYDITEVVTICEGESYQLPDGVVTDIAGAYPFMYNTMNGCDSLRTIQLVIQAPYVHTNHIQLCQGGSYVLPDGVVVNTTGYYPLVLQSFAGCDSTIITHITVTGLIQTFVTASFCSGTTYTLPDGVDVTTGGTYQSLLTSVTGCDSLVFTTLTVDAPVAMGILPLGDTLSICYGDSIFLEAFGASEYNWSPAENLDDPQGSSNWVGPFESTTYHIDGSNGTCVGADSVYIQVLPIPDVHIIADDIFVCEGDSIAISVTGADTYEWADNPLIDCLTCNNFMLVPNGVVTIAVTGNLDGCESSAILELGIMPNPVTIISGDSILCGEEITTLTALGATNYIWSTGDTTTTITVSPGDDEIYSVLGSLGDCVFADDILIEVYDYPEIEAGMDTLINLGDVITLEPSGGFTYSWFPDGSLSCLECENPDASPSVTTIYCVEGYNEFGCADTACVKVEVTIDCPTFFIPNAFAPEEGGDVANDCFRIYGNDCFDTFVLRVYDRWGEVVFETSDPDKCWDGNFAGKKMNSGVFVYYLDAVLLTGEPFIRKGNVTLMR